MLGAMVAGVAVDLLRPWPMKLLIDHVLGGEPLPPGFAALVAALPGGQSANALLAWASVATIVIFLGGSTLATVSLLTRPLTVKSSDGLVSSKVNAVP